jgi:hypothetical protein
MKTTAEIEKEFEKGYYSFRFEYTDKDGRRRFEVGTWNDGMPAKDALYNIAKHVSEYEDGKITDFIENKYFKSFLLSTLDERMAWVRSIVPKEEETRLDKLPKDIDIVDIGQRHGWNACREQFLSSLNSITKGSKED